MSTVTVRDPASTRRGTSHGAASRPSGPARRRRRRRRRPPLRDVAVTLAGAVGILVVLWLVFSWMFSLSVIVFVTGSMTPTMPTGTAAVVRTVPAAELRVGDVVTVDRSSGGTPVTHRIVAVEPAAASAERTLTLKGDDNAFPDRARYVVAEAGRVVASFPGVGSAVLALRSPVAMIAITVSAALVAAWGFWPSRRDRAAPRH